MCKYFLILLWEIFTFRGVAERLNAAVLKTVDV